MKALTFLYYFFFLNYDKGALLKLVLNLYKIRKKKKKKFQTETDQLLKVNYNLSEIILY